MSTSLPPTRAVATPNVTKDDPNPWGEWRVLGAEVKTVVEIEGGLTEATEAACNLFPHGNLELLLVPTACRLQASDVTQARVIMDLVGCSWVQVTPDLVTGTWRVTVPGRPDLEMATGDTAEAAFRSLWGQFLQKTSPHPVPNATSGPKGRK